MAAKRHSKEKIVQTLQCLAANLGKTTLSTSDVQRVVPVSSVCTYFGSLGNALRAAGLEPFNPSAHLGKLRRELSEEDLFLSIERVERNLGREPGANEYCAGGGYSRKPFKARFGPKWEDALAHYRKWRADRGQTKPGTDGDADHDGALVKSPTSRDFGWQTSRQLAPKPTQLYGEPIEFRGLRHAPINEQGVVYLFGMVSRELGFYVESIQQGFPDCEAKYRHDCKENRWARARIEFEFRASGFRDHGHDPTQCDFIICWMNDWPACPLPVIELKEEILKLPGR